MNKPYVFNQLIQFILKDFFDKLVKKNYWCLIKIKKRNKDVFESE